jgi:hypothetical protein
LDAQSIHAASPDGLTQKRASYPASYGCNNEPRAARFSTRDRGQMLEDYHQRQAAADQEYQQAYTEWIASMTPQERELLTTLGLDEPDLPRRSAGIGLSCDAAEQSGASCLDEIIDESAGPQEHDDDFWKVAADLRAGEAIIRIVSEILGGGNAALTTECLALATGVAYEGASESAIALKFGITRAAVSKRCIELSERLGVKNPRAMKTERAREIYRERAIAVHREAGREIAGEPHRGAKVETLGSHASRIAGIWTRLQKSDWIKSASAAELLLARRSLRPVFQVADELAAMIRSKNDPAITQQLDHDLGPPPPTRSLLGGRASSAASRTHIVKLCKN